MAGYHPAQGRNPLEHPLTIAELTSQQEQLRTVLQELEAGHRGSLYFPFFWWAGTQLRPMQYYLNKLPAANTGFQIAAEELAKI